LYNDWGDIHTPDQAGDDLKAFFAWGSSKPGSKDLFFRARNVEWITDLTTYVAKEGHMLLDVPLSEKMSEVMERVEAVLKLTYLLRGDQVRTGDPGSKHVLKLPVPKYMLHAPAGNLNAATEGAVAKAAYIGRLRLATKPDGKKLTVTETVLAIKRHADNPFGWKLTANDEKALSQGTYAKSILGGSEVVQVKRYRKDFDAYVRNTIHGRFPDNS
jgi:hypothetical protein